MAGHPNDAINEAEIIDFVSPLQNFKSLYISNISSSLNEDEIYNILYQKFSEFGLLYGIRIFPGLKTWLPSATSSSSLNQSTASNTEQATETAVKLPQDLHCQNICNQTKNECDGGSTSVQTVPCYYAFVNFYSRLACQKARRELSGNFFINGQLSKLIGAKRSKLPATQQPLPLVKCQELASYYLGFNGWSTKIKLLKENLIEDNGTTLGSLKKVTFCCMSEVALQHHGIVSEGFGAWEESYSSNDSLSKIVAYHKARKISYQRSLQDAFSKIILVVLPNGKVAAELNSTKADTFWKEASLVPVLEVNQLDSQPESEENIGSDLAVDTSQDLDDINIQLLQELEEF